MLGWGDHLVSLENVLAEAGLKARELRSQFAARTLRVWKAEFL